jgi:hypothetical protein
MVPANPTYINRQIRGRPPLQPSQRQSTNVFILACIDTYTERTLTPTSTPHACTHVRTNKRTHEHNPSKTYDPCRPTTTTSRLWSMSVPLSCRSACLHIYKCPALLLPSKVNIRTRFNYNSSYKLFVTSAMRCKIWDEVSSEFAEEMGGVPCWCVSCVCVFVNLSGLCTVWQCSLVARCC